MRKEVENETKFVLNVTHQQEEIATRPVRSLNMYVFSHFYIRSILLVVKHNLVNICVRERFQLSYILVK